MKKFLSQFHQDARGLTLVEIICAVAIMALISLTVAGIMNVSGTSYTRGVNEVELQEKMQLAVNQIDDLLIDSVSGVSYDASTGILTIVGENYYYEITRNASGELIYTLYNLDRTTIGSEVLTDDVEDFDADTSEYATTGNVLLTLKLKNGSGKTLESSYTITSRNGIVGGSATTTAAAIITANELVMEPNQVYELEYTLVGSPASVTWAITSAVDSTTSVYQDTTTGAWMLKVGKDETNSTFNMTVTASDTEGNTLFTKNVLVYVRRVTAITLYLVQTAPSADSGLVYGAAYTVSAVVTGNNLDHKYGVPNDDDYVSPYGVNWSHKWTYEESGSVIDNTSAISVTAASDSSYSFSIGTARTPELTDIITVYSYSKHASGNNKSGIAYGDVRAEVKIIKTFYQFDAGKLFRATSDPQGTLSEDLVKTYITAEQYNVNHVSISNLTLVKEFRYSVHNKDDWTSWIPMSEGGNAIRISESCYMFHCDEAYDVEIRFGVKTSDGTKYFPINLDPSAYIITATINRAQIKFDVYTGTPTEIFSNGCKTGSMTSVCTQQKTYGTQYAPVTVNVGDLVSMKVYQEAEDIMGFRWERYNQRELLTVQKLDGGTWKTVTSGYSCYYGGDNANFWLTSSISDNNMGFMTNYNAIRFTSTGTYRICVGLKNSEYVSYDESTGTFSTTSGVTYPRSTDDYGNAIDAGVIGAFYFKVQ